MMARRFERLLLIPLILLLAWPTGPSAAAVETKPAASAKHEEESRRYFTDLELITQDGEKVRFYSDVLKDRVVLISFVYTNCGDACPMMTRKLTIVRDMLGKQVGERIYFVSISIDPQRDSPAALKSFAEMHEADHDGWLFLTGDPKNIQHIVKKLGQYSQDVEDHSLLMLAGNVRNRHWMKIPPTVLPMAIAEKLRILVGED